MIQYCTNRDINNSIINGPIINISYHNMYSGINNSIINEAIINISYHTHVFNQLSYLRRECDNYC